MICELLQKKEIHKNKAFGKKRAAKGSQGRQTALLDLILVSPVLFNHFVRFHIVFVRKVKSSYGLIIANLNVDKIKKPSLYFFPATVGQK